MASTTLRPKSEDAPERFVFVLLDNFTLLSFASALDALRIANRMLDAQHMNGSLLARVEKRFNVQQVPHLHWMTTYVNYAAMT
jgi:transcriptional regulator GlxA family with amidase domain